MGLVEAATRQAENAAILFGAVNAVRTDAGLRPGRSDAAEEERQIDLLRSTLGPAVFEKHWSTGAAMGMPEAIEYCLRLSGVQQPEA
jgi:hypothetical protein